ncbi:hypothetical protein MMOR_42590 [Mycolicibacterium moriokaense]|uniref:Uncharacterized protein n=1 Tax=Mycolicibacterium moriokaense TaxID=39691 RepID=A0AAD1HFW5_9MYCO|nr:hypothetical protein MMOR_42590 [Mycolicibacterium moriokaense]
MITTRIDRKHDMSGRQRTQVVHQSRDFIAGFENHQATRTVERGRSRGNPLRKLTVGQLGGVGEYRDAVAMAAKVVDERAHVKTTPVPTTSMRTFASTRGGSRLA